MEQREIKFRIFDKKTNKYIEDADWVWSLSMSGKLYDSRNDEWYDIGDRFVIEFFTGLKDKNGKEIFDSDIILDCLTRATLQVKFEFCKQLGFTGWFCVPLNYSGKYVQINNDSDSDRNCQIEIIGNIYESPDLLK